MTARTVVVRLTVREAEALSEAAGNTTGHDDAMEAIFANGHERAAAGRAHEKLDDAIRAAGGFQPRPGR